MPFPWHESQEQMKRPSGNNAGPHRPTPTESAPEAIKPGELWPVGLLHTRLGWGSRAKAAAVRQGLKVQKFGRFSYVKTDDLITLLTSPREATDT